MDGLDWSIYFTIYYDEVDIISSLYRLFNGIPGGVLGRNNCSRLFSSWGTILMNTKIVNTITSLCQCDDMHLF